jgi:O-antigen ligase
MLTLLPLAIARLFTVRGWPTRALFAVYSVLTGGMIILTGTRGAWIGAGVALALLTYLLIRQYRIPINRTIMGGLGGLAVIGAVAVSLTRGWDTAGRTPIYEAAIQMFREKPVTGYGLFTFGRGLLRLVGIVPETTTHAQAHDIFLNVAAELGSVGLAVLLATLAVLFLAARRNWIAAGERELGEDRILIAGAVAASIGFGVHHVFDITAMLPAVTLVGLVALVVAVAPVAPLPVQRPRLRSVLLGGLVFLLLPTGVWETATYSLYMDGITRATHGDLSGGIQQMQAARDADPNMPVTLANLAFLQDMQGRHEEARKSVAALCRLEPYYAVTPYDASLSVLQFFRLSLLTTSQFWYRYSESPCAIRTTYGSLSR